MSSAEPRPDEPADASRFVVGNLPVTRSEAGEWLFRRFYRKVLGFFRHKGFEDDEARDLTQEAFARVYKNVGGLRLDLEKAGPWVLTVADNVYKNEIRRRRTGKRQGDETSLDDVEGRAPSRLELAVVERSVPEADPLDRLLERERTDRLHDAVEALPPKMRRAVVLFLRGFKYREIATLMNVSIETVKSQLHQAKARLREALGEEVL